MYFSHLWLNPVAAKSRISKGTLKNVFSVAKLYYGLRGGAVVKNPPAMQEMQETRVWSLGWEGPLEEEVATHSSILAWRIPWIEEPGGLQSLGSQRVRQDWARMSHISHIKSCHVVRLYSRGASISTPHSLGFVEPCVIKTHTLLRFWATA